MTPPTPPEESGTQREKTWFEKQMENPWFQAGLYSVYLALYILLGIILWGILDWYIKPQDSTEKKDLIQALGLIMAGVAGAIGIYFTWRGQRITQRTQEETQRNTQEQLRLTREGQITDRFMRAIDQLGAADEAGNPRLEIRLGGIYALERIARDSPERDYSTVIEVLAAYVRENAPAPEEVALKGPSSPSTDIQAILEVFKRLQKDRVREKNPHVFLSLPGSDLRGASLQKAHLEEASFYRAHLEGASFYRARLEGAFLAGAYLEGAILQKAHLEGANLRGATGLTQEQIDEAYGDKVTKLPEGLVRPAHWSKSTDEQQTGEK